MTHEATGGIQNGAGERVRNIDEALASIHEPWQPHRLVSVNDYDVKVVKFQGEFVWHTHPETDELFIVRSGRLTIRLRTGDVVLGPGDAYVVPAGAEHCPAADEETAVLLFEPKGTVNTGDVGGERTEQLREL
jgi:mannose-6-phosphate isomerase-like protein (cupin superfamily)